MAVESLGSYTEVDPSNNWTVEETKLTCTNMNRQTQDSYVYKDYGTGYFDGDLECFFDLNLGTVGNIVISNCLAFTNDLDDMYAIDVANKSMACVQVFGITGTEDRMYIADVDEGNSQGSAALELNEGTQYYLTFIRDESVTTYGQYQLYAYDDAERTSLVEAVTRNALGSKKDYRYVMAGQSYGNFNASPSSWVTENLDIGEEAPVSGTDASALFLEFF
jgi:hypothetical protein